MATSLLTQTIQNLTQENHSLINAVSELNQKARTKEDQITALSAQIKQNESEKETKKIFDYIAVQGLGQTISRLDAANKTLDAANKTLVSEKDVLELARGTLIGENASLTEANAKLTGENASLTEANAKLTGENASIKEANLLLTTEKADLVGANATLTTEKADLQKANTRLKIGVFTVAFVAGGIIAAMKTGAVEPTVASIKALLKR